ncbi:surface-adhesin E family protein [Trinickia diaoshuihuensis]|uniref:surface-adhesin E family protein n=1 Tax=Trinickia diaoshuihuensis TaxID=2292265 RepID=UPI003B835E42
MSAKNDRETVYLDGGSIKRDEYGNVLVRTKHDLSAHPMVVNNRFIATSMERDAFDCSRDRVRFLSTAAYDRNGALLAAVDSSSTF